jgi:hypothetical protein
MRFAAVVTHCLLCGLASPSVAQTRDARKVAAEHMERGLRHYNTQEYDLAVEAWRQAYGLDPNPNTLFAIGQAQRLKGDCPAAMETYRTVLRERVSAAQATEVKRVLKMCEEELKKKPPPPPPPPNAEPDAVTPAAPLEPEPDRQLEPAPDPEPAPPPAPPPPAPDPWYTDWIGDTLLGLTVVSAASAATFLHLASRAENDAEDEQRFDAFVDKAETAERNRRIAVGSVVAGAVFGAAAIVRLMTREPSHAGTTVGVAPSAGGATFTVGGHF